MAATGATIYEVSGEGKTAKTDLLAARLSELLPKEVVRFARPVKRADLRISGLNDSTTKEQVAAAVVSVGGCLEGEVKVGEIRRTSGLGSAWAQCPATAAKKVAGAGRLVVG